MESQLNIFRMRIFHTSLTLLVVLLLLSSAPTGAQSSLPTDPMPVATPAIAANPNLLLADDIMPPVKPGIPAPVSAEATDYTVIPILFVPNDLTANPLGLQFIDRQMQMIQRWYGEQLRDRTFELEATRIVTGTHPLSYYYGACYPPSPTCQWGYELWYSIFADLYNLGYPYQYNRVVGVFFQNDGVGAPALGGGNQFLVGIDTDNVTLIEDCPYPGCASSVNKGGVAHELGHAFGLPHTADDPEGSPGISLMNYGFYNFPRATFVNTSVNPERDTLNQSPFINTFLLFKNGGFAGCLTSWNVSAGTPSCTSADPLSGLSSLKLTPNYAQYRVSQDVIAVEGETVDFSGWLRIVSQTGNFTLEVHLLALAPSGTVRSTLVTKTYTGATAGWERFGTSWTLPPGATSLRVQIDGQGLGATAYFDDLSLSLTQQPPPQPIPVSNFDREAFPTLQPTLRWSDSSSATTFRLQISADKSFGSALFDQTTSSPFYTISSSLTDNTRTFWRVKAINGSGESDWSITWSLYPRAAGNYYNDEFETGSLSGAWSWVRRDWRNWFFGGPPGRRSYGYLGITAQGGDLENWGNAKNLLLKYPPAGDFEISTKIDFWDSLNADYQQGGLLVYQNDQNFVKLTRIHRGMPGLDFQVKAGGALVHQSFTPMWSPVPIKIARTGNAYSAYYTADGIRWKRLGLPVTANLSNPRVGLAAFSVAAAQTVTAYFDWFRLTPRCYEMNASAFPPSGGSIATSPGGDCNADTGYSGNSPVTITATPSDLFTFCAWGGDFNGQENPGLVTMNGDKTIIALFAHICHQSFLPQITR